MTRAGPGRCGGRASRCRWTARRTGWEHFEALVDPSQGDQEYVEDCHICCRPLVLTVDLTDPEAPSVSVTPEND